MYDEVSLGIALFWRLDVRVRRWSRSEWSQALVFMGFACILLLETMVVRHGHLTIPEALVRGLDYHFDFHRIGSGG